MNTTIDLMVTWPKTRTLDSYLSELKKAETKGQYINFRVSTFPKRVVDEPVLRCFMVHSGYIRGYNYVEEINWYPKGEITDPITGELWPSGYYITRDPRWFPVEPIIQQGFQGYRYLRAQPV